MPDTTERATELRSLLLEQSDKLRELRGKSPADRGDSYAQDCNGAISAIRMLDSELVGIERSHSAVPQFANPQAATADLGQRESVSLGRLISYGDGTRDWAKRGHRDVMGVEVGTSYFDRRFRGAHEARAVIDEADTASTDAKAFLPVGQPYLAPASVERQRLFLQDIVPGGSTLLPAVPYIRELNPRITQSGATSVAEGASKPEVTNTFEQDTALVKKIAAWVHLTSEIIEDAPTLMSYINGRLPYMVDLAAEKMFLRGNPSGDPTSCRGILNFTGIQNAGTSSNTVGSSLVVSGDPATTLAKCNAAIELAYGSVDAYVLNPVDYWAMVSHRWSADGTHNTGGYDSEELPFGIGPQGAWGMPVVRTPAMNVGQFLAGNFRLAAQILMRQETLVKMGWINDDFVKNLQVVLAELRGTVLVYRPDWFITGTFS